MPWLVRALAGALLAALGAIGGMAGSPAVAAGAHSPHDSSIQTIEAKLDGLADNVQDVRERLVRVETLLRLPGAATRTP
jgi:hypothetical protein